jgi:predicted nucleic acid-binding protein
LVIPIEKISLCRDIEDNKILECALAGKVDFIVSGDKDLLSLHLFKNIPIITPRKFLEFF